MNGINQLQRRLPALEENKLVGTFAENAVRDYFEASGFTMCRFGVEHVFPEWAEVIAEDAHADPQMRGTLDTFAQQQNLSRFLRSFPDFVAIRTVPSRNGVREIFPVEVKFRTERVFPGKGRPLQAVRLSDDSVAGYKEHWPSTLLVVVCYRNRTMLGTRVGKLAKIPDSRVPIRDSGHRRSWFYNIAGNGFRPLWDFEQGCFDPVLGARTVAEVITFADQARQREGLALA